MPVRALCAALALALHEEAAQLRLVSLRQHMVACVSGKHFSATIQERVIAAWTGNDGTMW